MTNMTKTQIIKKLEKIWEELNSIEETYILQNQDDEYSAMWYIDDAMDYINKTIDYINEMKEIKIKKHYTTLENNSCDFIALTEYKGGKPVAFITSDEDLNDWLEADENHSWFPVENGNYYGIIL